MYGVALTIAGSDPSGGAGLQADLKTFHQHGVYGMSVVTLLTVQNTQSVSRVEILDASFVCQQIECVVGDIPPQAAKTGALGNAAVIDAIANRAMDFDFPLVVDPVMISKHGNPLLENTAVDSLKFELLPRAFLVTPNLPEAAALVDMEITDISSMEIAAERIAEFGPKHVLIKGGHLDGDAVDLLWSSGKVTRLTSERIATKHTHGTGCVFSSAITARLAKGDDVEKAVRGAKQFVREAIRTNPELGKGLGPLNLFAKED